MGELSRTRTYEEHSSGYSRSKSNLYRVALKSIVLISRKYDLDPKLLIEAFAEAWRNKTSCERISLTIYCREINHDFVTFLITNGDKVVSQFPIKIDVLKDPDFFKNLMQNSPIQDYEQRKIYQKQKKIGELRFGMEGINIRAKILDITPKKLVVTSFGNQIYVSNVRLVDETGTIRLSLWNSQIDQVHVGDEVEITDCHVGSFAGEPQLRIKRKGGITIV